MYGRPLSQCRPTLENFATVGYYQLSFAYPFQLTRFCSHALNEGPYRQTGGPLNYNTPALPLHLSPRLELETILRITIQVIIYRPFPCTLFVVLTRTDQLSAPRRKTATPVLKIEPLVNDYHTPRASARKVILESDTCYLYGTTQELLRPAL